MSRVRTCFISAPADSNLSVLRNLLTARNIAICGPETMAPGASIPGEIGQILSEVDLVIGVLSHKRRSDWTLFELGQAWAKGRQILLIAPPRSGDYLPSDLNGMITLRTSLTNREAISFALDQLVAAPERRIRQEVVPPKQPHLYLKAANYLELGRQAVAHRRGRELEQLLADAIREAGVETLATEPAGRRGVDMAVWADGLQRTVGNPLLIEVKLSAARSSVLRDTAAAFSKELGAAGVRWGLLILGEAPSDRPLDAALPPNVLAITVEDLLQRMRAASLSDIVNELRNRRVHGVGN